MIFYICRHPNRIQMKKRTIIFLFILCTTMVLAQKKEKIKGSKTVTTEQKVIGIFNVLEISDNIEVYLEKAEKPELKIEADDNLHAILNFDLIKDTLRITTSKEATKYKKLMVRINYTNDLKKVISKNEAEVNAIQELQLDDITIQTLGNSKFYMNVNAKNFLLLSDEKSKVELNLKSGMAKIILSKEAYLKSLINSTDLDFDIYQKSRANIEGDVTNAKIRVDNNAVFTGNKLTAKNAIVISENNSKATINAVETATIEAGDKSEIKLIGNPKIEIKKLTEEAKLMKGLK